MANIIIDTSEVDAFAAELKGVPQELSRHAIPVLKRAAQNIKEAQQTDFEGSSNKSIRGIARKVAYDDVSEGPGGYETEIGIDKGGHGDLGNIAVFGTWKGGGTHMHPHYYAEREMPNFETAIDNLVESLIP